MKSRLSFIPCLVRGRFLEAGVRNGFPEDYNMDVLTCLSTPTARQCPSRSSMRKWVGSYRAVKACILKIFKKVVQGTNRKGGSN